MPSSLIGRATEAAFVKAPAWALQRASTGPTWLRFAGLAAFLLGLPFFWISKLLGLACFAVGLWLLLKPWSPRDDLGSPPRATPGPVPPWEKGSRPKP